MIIMETNGNISKTKNKIKNKPIINIIVNIIFCSFHQMIKIIQINNNDEVVIFFCSCCSISKIFKNLNENRQQQERLFRSMN